MTFRFGVWLISRLIKPKTKVWNLRWCLHDAFFLSMNEIYFCLYVALFRQTSFFRGIRSVPFRSEPRNGLFREARNSAE
jgi:hypothetical protein